MKLFNFCKATLALYALGSFQIVTGDFVYVTNYNANTVSQIDTETNTVTATIDVSSAGNNPYGIAVSSTGENVYVAMRGSGGAAHIDVASGFTVTGIPLSTIVAAQAVAITPNDQRAYFPEASGGGLLNIAVVDTSTNTEGTPIPASSNVGTSIAIAPNGLYGYLASSSVGGVEVFSVPDNVTTGTVAVTGNPFGVAITPDGTMGYVTTSSNDVFPFSTATNTPGLPIPVGSNPTGIAITHDGLSAYVCNYNDGTVSHIDLTTGTVVATITVGGSPIAIAITADDSAAYVVNSSVVVPIDLATDTPGADIAVGNLPTGIASRPIFVLPPSDLMGIQILNRFFFVGELFNKLTWQPALSAASYRIYRNGTLIATISGETLTYSDHDVTPDVVNTYEVTSVDANGTESLPATVVIP